MSFYAKASAELSMHSVAGLVHRITLFWVRLGVVGLGACWGVSGIGSALSICPTFDIQQTTECPVKQKVKPLSEKQITPAQCRGARGMLSWSQADLADRARVSRPTVVDFEKGTRSPMPNNLAAIRTALESAGVEFIAENGGGLGVRLCKPDSPSGSD